MKKSVWIALLCVLTCLFWAMPVFAGEGAEPQIEAIEITETDVTLLAGDTYSPEVSILPQEITDFELIWESSDEEVATVDETGEITAVGIGTATVTVSVGSLSDSLQVKVLFNDVFETDYFYNDVYWALENNITRGISAAEFGPYDGCTRAQVVTLLYRLNGEPAVNGSAPFKDVLQNTYCYNAVCWAYQNKIVSGTSATTFSPESICTRGQIVTFLWRCQRQWPEGKSSFSDVVSGNYYFYPVAWAVEQNITAGTSATTFSPDNPCTRGQIVRFLHNCDKSNAAKLNPALWQLYYPKAEAVLNAVGWDLRAAFNWSTYLTYYGHGKADMPETPYNGSEWFANFGFDNHKGNCLVMAGTFWEMAVVLGYDCRQMFGYVPLASGGMGPHSWVEVIVNGTSYVCDPDFTYNYRQKGSNRNGYLIHYGQSGTWQYSSYSPMSR